LSVSQERYKSLETEHEELKRQHQELSQHHEELRDQHEELRDSKVKEIAELQHLQSSSIGWKHVSANVILRIFI
jgi:phage shock protein A